MSASARTCSCKEPSPSSQLRLDAEKATLHQILFSWRNLCNLSYSFSASYEGRVQEPNNSVAFFKRKEKKGASIPWRIFGEPSERALVMQCRGVRGVVPSGKYLLAICLARSCASNIITRQLSATRFA